MSLHSKVLIDFQFLTLLFFFLNEVVGNAFPYTKGRKTQFICIQFEVSPKFDQYSMCLVTLLEKDVCEKLGSRAMPYLSHSLKGIPRGTLICYPTNGCGFVPTLLDHAGFQTFSIKTEP